MEQKTLLPRLFASLTSIEKAYQFLNEKLSEKNGMVAACMALHDLSRAIIKMRRTANFLQIAVAKNDVNEAFRLLGIFYGLNHMVRPELQQRLDEVSVNGDAPVVSAPTSADGRASMH